MASTGLNSSVQEADVAASRVDIIVALTSYNDEGTVGGVSRAVREGLSRYFGSAGARIVLVDGGSTDATRDAARDAVGPRLVEVECAVPGAGLADLPYHGQPGRARALKAALEILQRSDAKACVFVDASLDTAEPWWIDLLVEPVLNGGFDYVSPYYVRAVHEGAITKGIVYPMFRSLYGVRIRQPAVTVFSCSSRLASHYLEQDFWDAEQAQAGIDLWLAAAAACGQFRLCEAELGARGSSSRETRSDLSTTLAQVVGALFADIEQHVDAWQRIRGSVPVPRIGVVHDEAPAPVPADVPDALVESFRLGYRELREIWTWVLPPRTIVELRRLTEAPPERFRFDDRFWAGIVYDFAIAYSQHVMPRDHLLRSLTPLYTGWLGSFVLQMKGATVAEAEDRVDRVCLGFEAEKRYLISRWRWPERFR